MKIGFVALPVADHLNPMTARARQLQSTNHDLTYLRSHGEFEKIPFGLNLARLSPDVFELVKASKLKRISFLGHQWALVLAGITKVN
jgi:hypothetical protein